MCIRRRRILPSMRDTVKAAYDDMLSRSAMRSLDWEPAPPKPYETFDPAAAY